MEKLVIEHKDFLKKSAGYFIVTLALVAIIFAAGDQFELSVGAWILMAALALEVGMTISTLITAFTKEIFDETGITVTNFLSSKTYAWKDLERFEIHWDYKGRRVVGKQTNDAPYILLKFVNPKKKIRFDYLEVIDQHIRTYYGEPHVDNWTNIGK